jgi:hypothetical protein
MSLSLFPFAPQIEHSEEEDEDWKPETRNWKLQPEKWHTEAVPRSLAREQDILKRSPPKRPPALTSRRIGIHTSSAGGVQWAAERAYRLGCNTFQIFSSSPRQWAPHDLDRPQCEQMKRLRGQYDLKPLVIHTNYLVNLAGVNELFLKKSVEAFRGEIERALALCAEYLVLHPGSFRGSDREQGLVRTVAAIAAAAQGLDLDKSGLTILIEQYRWRRILTRRQLRAGCPGAGTPAPSGSGWRVH